MPAGIKHDEATNTPCAICKSTDTWRGGTQKKTCSRDCERQVMSIKFSGEKNPAWRGGFPLCKVCGKELSRTQPQKGRKYPYTQKCKLCAAFSRRNTNPKHLMAKGTSKIIKSRFAKCVRKDGRKTKYEIYLGCSFSELRTHIESQFWPHMTWDNFGKRGWHMDHIKPLSSFDLSKEEERYEAFNYKNLQPLWWFLNLSKGAKFGAHKYEESKLRCGHAGKLLFFVWEKEKGKVVVYKTQSYEADQIA